MEKARYKRSKFGCLPGDISKRHKIAMLETTSPIQVWPWQLITPYAAKVYRKDHQKRANRRFRHAAAKDVSELNEHR